ncbi:hypothetical protein M406DRAFT_350487 [Cryphonectria parasitica EP155]|uniref:Xylanolytic transcriptional activator regulatory domain-containing protein n=1 Tax=Cryphonectria parasitica (strain ATCC 38755 / EP155) TaxID=660469 RepID=A0A9P5CQJ4_CRYP1|nr:uncharacterized protein M406DRAFT_350487 [Cryphonectria parasitica EP155]KAF3767298.1 hypothetical protein M406DRAFT_350487 [Cryphonectria parasitica EP155]
MFRSGNNTGPGPAGIQKTANGTSALTEKYRRNGKLQSCPDANHAQCQPFHRAASAPPLDYQRPPDARRNTGFEGPTSHLSILTETLVALDPEPTGLETLDQQQNIVITNARITQGCSLLSFFKNRSMITHFMAKYYELSEGAEGLVIAPIMKEWLHQLWFVHADTLARQDPVKIRKLSERIWRNTLTPIEFDGNTTAMEYARAGSGLNLRWEVLGLICSNVSFALVETPSSDKIFIDHQVSRVCLIDMMREISEKCLVFCRYCEVLDDMFVWLLVDYSINIQVIKGDRQYATYRASGEAHSAVIALGLHQGTKANKKVPFFMAELRKLTFLAAYFCEISLATSLGRPPRLSYRYCNVEPPLDLSEPEMVQTGTDLAATLASLDDDGYNKAEVLRNTTSIRAYVKYVHRREDVVDLALGQYTRDEVLARAKTIQEKNEAHLASLPPWVREIFMEPLDFSGKDADLKPLVAVRRGALRTGRLSNEILLQRVLIRKAGASSEKLTQAALAVFRDVLQITGRHDIAMRFQASYNVYLCAHGLRSAAIVAIELLKQEMAPQYPENPALPRSQTIQDLAVFASRLAAVDTSDGSYQLCEQGHRVISKILDRILSPQGAAERQRDEAGRSRIDVTQAQPPNGGHGGGDGGEESQGMMAGQMDVDMSLNAIVPPLNPMAMMTDFAGYGMIDTGIGVGAPMSLGHDTDFMAWLQGMNWEPMDNWSM